MAAYKTIVSLVSSASRPYRLAWIRHHWGSISTEQEQTEQLEIRTVPDTYTAFSRPRDEHPSAYAATSGPSITKHSLSPSPPCPNPFPPPPPPPPTISNGHHRPRCLLPRRYPRRAGHGDHLFCLPHFFVLRHLHLIRPDRHPPAHLQSCRHMSGCLLRPLHRRVVRAEENRPAESQPQVQRGGG